MHQSKHHDLIYVCTELLDMYNIEEASQFLDIKSPYHRMSSPVSDAVTSYVMFTCLQLWTSETISLFHCDEEMQTDVLF